MTPLPPFFGATRNFGPRPDEDVSPIYLVRLDATQFDRAVV